MAKLTTIAVRTHDRRKELGPSRVPGRVLTSAAVGLRSAVPKVLLLALDGSEARLSDENKGEARLSP